MRYEHEDIGDERARKRVGLPPKQVTRALLTFYIIGALLNGEHLLAQAELMPFGVWHTVCVTATRPLAHASRITGLSAPRYWIEEQIASQQ